jgi:hypothetical protein
VSTTSPTGTALGLNHGLRSEMMATNRLNHGTAYTLLHYTAHSPMFLLAFLFRWLKESQNVRSDTGSFIYKESVLILLQ